MGSQAKSRTRLSDFQLKFSSEVFQHEWGGTYLLFFFSGGKGKEKKTPKEGGILAQDKGLWTPMLWLMKILSSGGAGGIDFVALFVLLGWASGVDFAGALSLESEPSSLLLRAPGGSYRLLCLPDWGKSGLLPGPRRGSWVGLGGAWRGSCPLCWRPAAPSPLGFLFLQLFRKDWK